MLEVLAILIGVGIFAFIGYGIWRVVNKMP
jgi:hypothetical protein